MVVLYWSGHSAIADDGQHYLYMSDSTDAAPESPAQPPGAVIATARLGRMLAARIPGRLLVILDTSYAARGVQELINTSEGRDLWAVSSAGPEEQAYDGAFIDAFLRALDDKIPPPQQPYLALESLAESVNRQLAAVQPGQHVFFHWQAPVEPPLFFPNPRYLAQTAAEIDSDIADLDFHRHFLPQARGVAAGSELGWYFTGRTAALRDLVNFMSAESPRTLMVTGGPGSGKSAVLGRLVVLADRDFRNLVPFADIPPDTIPALGSVDAAIYAVGKSLANIVTALAAVAGVPDLADAGSLPSAIAARGTPFTIVLDALDEAPAPDEIVRRLLRPLASTPGIRLIIGTRRFYIRRLDPSGSATVIDLDSPPYLSTADLSGYARRILVAGDGRSGPTPYADYPELATAVANVVAQAASPSFLVARMLAQMLAAQPAAVDPTSPDWRARLPRTAGAAFEASLAAHLGSGEEPRLRRVLTPLAYAEGAGLPWADIWARVASALAQQDVTDEDIIWMREMAGDYVVEAIERGHTVYRLSHQTLAEYLRLGQDEAEAQRRITRALIDKVRLLPGGVRDWSATAPYILDHLASHAAAAGMLTELLEDPGYVRAADPETLRAAQEGSSAVTTTASPDISGRPDRARIVAVHGVGQQAVDPSALYNQWFFAMQEGMQRAGIPRSLPSLAVAYYGDLFRLGGET